MNIKSLSLKNLLSIEKTGEQYLDLTAPSFKYKKDLGLKALHYVMQDEAGRVDKIADKYFGDGEYIDAICVVNNIFNPFSVQEGDILIIPNLDDLNLVYKRPNPASRPNPVMAPFVDTGRQSTEDQSRVQRLAQKAKSKKSGVKTPLPPNLLQQGQEAKTFKGGNIQLGTNLPTRNNY